MNVTADPKTSARSAADPGRGGWLRARPMLAAALIYAVLSLLMVGPALVPGKTLSASDYLWNNPPWQATRPASVVGIGSNFELADQPLVFQPFLQYTRDVLPHVPLWNPHISGGRPYLANNQSAVFSLFNIPAYILPFWSALAVIAVIKLFVAALGALCPGPAARAAIRRRPAHRARVRLRDLLHPAAGMEPAGDLGGAALDADPGRHGRAKTGPASGGRASHPGGAELLRRARGDHIPRPAGGGGLLCLPPCGCAGAPSGWRPAPCSALRRRSRLP